MSETFKNSLLANTATVRDAFRRIEFSKGKIALVTDDAGRLVGTLTDGDLRRGLLRGHGLDDPALELMNTNPQVATDQETTQSILSKLKALRLRHLPVVDADGVLVKLVTFDELFDATPEPDVPNKVLLMAGGEGSRLRPLTENCPKPMLKVGSKPILETILGSFIEQGFSEFVISVNYMGDQIVRHFGDGSQWQVSIEYLQESEPLGTAGPIGLLDTKPEHTMIVMNGDILTKVDFRHMLSFHEEHGAEATMCIREFDFRVPFGTVDLSDHVVKGIREKPVYSFFVNAGIYVIDPPVIDMISPGERLDITDLFQKFMDRGGKVSAFPVHEYWMDIGQMDDFRQAQDEYDSLFSR